MTRVLAWNPDVPPTKAVVGALRASIPLLDALANATASRDPAFEIDRTLGYDAPLPHLDPCRTAHRFAQAHAAAAAYRGDGAGARRALLVSLGLSQIVARDEFTLSSLIAVRMAWEAISLADDFSRLGVLGEADAAALRPDLERLAGDDPAGFSRAMDLEVRAGSLLLTKLEAAGSPKERLIVIETEILEDPIDRDSADASLRTDDGLAQAGRQIRAVQREARDLLRAMLAGEAGVRSAIRAFETALSRGDDGTLAPRYVPSLTHIMRGHTRMRGRARRLAAEFDAGRPSRNAIAFFRLLDGAGEDEAPAILEAAANANGFLEAFTYAPARDRVLPSWPCDVVRAATLVAEGIDGHLQRGDHESAYRDLVTLMGVGEAMVNGRALPAAWAVASVVELAARSLPHVVEAARPDAAQAGELAAFIPPDLPDEVPEPEWAPAAGPRGARAFLASRGLEPPGDEDGAPAEIHVLAVALMVAAAETDPPAFGDPCRGLGDFTAELRRAHEGREGSAWDEVPTAAIDAIDAFVADHGDALLASLRRLQETLRRAVDSS